MTTTEVVRTIEAPVAEVFDTIAHIENFSKAVPHITAVEFLTEQHRGVGTRFRETRRMRNRFHDTELEVTEYVEDERIRLVSDQGGTVWDTVFTVAPAGGGTELTMMMDARPHQLLARATVPLFRRMVAKAVNADMDAVKAYCENG